MGHFDVIIPFTRWQEEPHIMWNRGPGESLAQGHESITEDAPMVTMETTW